MQANTQQHISESSEQKNGTSYPDALPRIANNNTALHTLLDQSLHALKAVNSPPSLFQQNGKPVRVRRWEGNAHIEEADTDVIRLHLDRAASHVRRSRPYRDNSHYTIEPPLIDTARAFLVMDSYPQDVLPVLWGVTPHPYFTKSGRLVIRAGYDPESRRFYHPDPSLALPPIPEEPTKEEVTEAAAFIYRELLQDFPLGGWPNITNAFGFIIQQFVREMIQGPTPLCLIEAPVPGTGKSLLANCIAIPSTGRTLAAMPPRMGDEEWRKSFTAGMIQSPPFIFMDNLTGRFGPAPLAVALIEPRWRDRILGETRMIDLPISCGWLATGNNLELSPDIARRTVLIRLDSLVESPESRDVTKYRHPRLLQWAQEHRSELIRSVLVLVKAWIAAGQPKGTETMGSYESWTEVIGGILTNAGFKGFLTNRDELRLSTNSDIAEFGQFVSAWVDQFKPGKRRVDELFTLLQKCPYLLPYVNEADSEHGRRARLGKYLSKKRDRVFRCLQLKILPGTDKSRRLYYTLEPTIEEKHEPAHSEHDQTPSDEPKWPQSFFDSEYEEPPPPQSLEEITDA